MHRERAQRRNYQVPAIAAELGFALAAQRTFALQQNQTSEQSEAQGHAKEILHPVQR